MPCPPSKTFSNPGRIKHVLLYFSTTRTQIPDEPEKLGDGKRDEVEKKATELGGGETLIQQDIDLKAVGAFEELFTDSDPRQYLTFSLARWEEARDGLLHEALQYKTLFLFDLDFRNEASIGGDENTGIKLIQIVLGQEDVAQNVVCGLLSHKCGKGEEYEKWIGLAEQNSINRDRFVMISKLRLSDNDLDGFAWMLKLTLLNEPCRVLRTRAAAALEAALSKAEGFVAGIHVYDFDQIILKSSLEEGIWEPDTLFRIFGIFHRKEARQKAFIDEDLNTAVTSLRKITRVPVVSQEGLQTESWKIRAAELYEPREYLNKYHIPIDLGDIFQKTRGTSQYILLAQPCDLMVRKEGERNRKLDQVFLVRIKQDRLSEEKLKDDPSLYGSVCELPYFGEQDGEKWYAYFADSHPSSLLPLDMCVFREDGKAIFALDEPCPENMIPSWRLRHEKIRAQVENAVANYEQLHSFGVTNREACRLVTPQSTYGQEDMFSRCLNPVTKTIEYGLMRVRRVCSPIANAVLQRFLGHWARAALDHDFARQR